MSVNSKSGKRGVLDMALCAMFAALLAICSWISLTVGDIPFTLQTFGIFLALGLLGGKRGTIAVLVYLLLGAVGLPVFAHFMGGIGVILGTTGGYIFGFLLSALLYWGVTALLGEKAWVQLMAMILGLAVCYAVGTIWFVQVYVPGEGAPAMTYSVALAKCVIPFLIPDGVKLALAWILTARLKRYVP